MQLDLHVRFSAELLDQVARHALFQGVAADDERHRAGVTGKVQSGLAGRVSGADQMDVESVGGARFAPCRAVVDALADEPIEAVDREATPGDAGSENDGSCPDDVAAAEVDLTRFRIHWGDRG